MHRRTETKLHSAFSRLKRSYIVSYVGHGLLFTIIDSSRALHSLFLTYLFTFKNTCGIFFVRWGGRDPCQILIRARESVRRPWNRPVRTKREREREGRREREGERGFGLSLSVRSFLVTGYRWRRLEH